MSEPNSVTKSTMTSKDASPDQQPSLAPEICCEKIREAAYYKWEAAGYPCGDGTEFWLQAEAELACEWRSEESRKQ